MKAQEVFYGVVIFVMILVVVYTSYNTWTLGGDEDDYHVVCIGGHQYYRANFLQKMGIAPKLDDDGKPVKCD